MLGAPSLSATLPLVSGAVHGTPRAVSATAAACVNDWQASREQVGGALFRSTPASLGETEMAAAPSLADDTEGGRGKRGRKREGKVEKERLKEGETEREGEGESG